MAKKKGRGRGNAQQNKQRSRNLYDALGGSFSGRYGSGNMNEHLTERFGAARRSLNDDDGRYPDPELVPLAPLSRTNKDIEKYYEDARRPVVKAGAWISKPEIPTSSEISPAGPSGFDIEQIIDLHEELRPNKAEGAYESNEEYLGTQYELLREDAIRPLRRAVEEVRKDPSRDESEYPQSIGIGIYEPVYLKGVQFSYRGLSAKVAFSLSRVKKYIRWRQSKRLITGTLVALTPYDDAFQDMSKCILATVGARPLSGLESNNPPEIDLFFAHTEEFDFDPMRKWIMVEARTSFFEASRHTLLALQHMMRETFPLSEHLVKCQTEVEPPEYVRINPLTDMSSLVSIDEAERFQEVNILQEWPMGESLTLDNSQSKALRRMMTKRLAIVQGPPGTGKTHVSVVNLKTQLANLRMGDPPIIVACQTNHALDQLLRHVAEFEAKFVRLGGQTKDQDKIKKRTLFEVRDTFEKPKLPGSRKNQAMGVMRRLTAKMQMLLAPFEMGKPPLDHRFLVRLGLITETQAASLEQSVMDIPQNTPGIQMEQWLGRCLTRCTRPIQPDDFGMAYEEEDFDEIEQLQELEAEAVARDDEDDIEALRGPISYLSDNFRGMTGRELMTDAEINGVLDEAEDLATIPIQKRGAIYNYFLRKAKQIVLGEFRDLARQYDACVFQRKIGQWEQDQRILLQQRLIGTTTTGLSKYRPLIASLRPRVVLIEEAAETLEAPVTVACFPTLEHLILVGDHQQLRPHCNLHELENEPYNFNLSLFERMVRNHVQVDTLKRQRRMIPEIRRLLKPIYGDTLKDHASVQSEDNRPPVEGMGGVNSFFFTHEWPESRDNNQSSKNEKEADMIVGFFDYLVLNGVDPRKITVLTFYNGQRKLLTSRLRNNQNLRGQALKVVTVDSYQGEENDIVLLSLVRSNRTGQIGFLSVDNRVCVALSRAKRGFYLFGNAELLVCQSDTWEAVTKIMWGRGKVRKDIPRTGPERRIGFRLPLTCAKHGNKVFIEDPGDWEFMSGGCEQRCSCLLPCGHTCMLRCHPFDNTRINCTQKCNRVVPTCGHTCGQMCCDPCKCMICERRNDGRKAMIKPLPMSNSNTYMSTQPTPPSGSSFRAQPTLLIPVSEPPAAPDVVSENSASTPAQWQAFAQRGVKADDAQALQRDQKDAAKFQELISTGSGSSSSAPTSGKLIEVTPKKKPIPENTSANTNLLVDLLDDSPTLNSSAPSKGERVNYSETFSYVGAMTRPNSSKAKQNVKLGKTVMQPVFNLLD